MLGSTKLPSIIQKTLQEGPSMEKDDFDRSSTQTQTTQTTSVPQDEEEPIVKEFRFPNQCGGFKIEAAIGHVAKHGEDRYSVVTSAMEPSLVKVQSQNELPTLVAYFGVFDGHDGVAAAEYCSKGLLQHILSETSDIAIAESGKTHKNDKKHVADVWKRGFIRGYHHAESRFGANSSPPTFDEMKLGVQRTRTSKTFIERYSCMPKKLVRGGTTALTLNFFSKEETTPIHEAIVANCGDCRCITDDGTGSSTYRQVTIDHRPDIATEHRRLKPYIRNGTATVNRLNDCGHLRVFPGGLSVSRTIGDVGFSSAVISSPDVFHVPLCFDKRGKRQRFLMACDGLWEVLDNIQVGKVIASRQRKPQSFSEKVSLLIERDVGVGEAVKAVFQEIMSVGGCNDDVTVLVIDVALCDH